MVALAGPEGVGKTQLAVEFAHRYGRYFAGGVYWVTFDIPDHVSLQVAACGGPDGMGLRADFTDLALDDQIHLVLRAWQSPTPRLLVCDDCDDENLLREWLPASSGVHVIVTSRQQEWSPVLGLSSVELAPLSREQGALLLRRLLNGTSDRDTTLHQLVEELGGLPLALRLAGGLLATAKSGLAPDSYLKQLRSRDTSQHPAVQAAEAETGANSSSRSPSWRRRGNQGTASARAYATADLWLARNDRSARALLSQAACLAPGEPVPRELLVGLEPDRRASAALDRLLGLGLLEADGEQVRIHRQISELTRERDDGSEPARAAEDSLVTWASGALDSGDTAVRLTALPHLAVAGRASFARGGDERAASIAFELGRALWAAGDLRRARASLERALEIRERVLGRADQRTIATLSSLGSLLQAQGDLAGAQATLERALAVAEATLGTDHVETAQILTTLAWTLRYQGDLAGARRLLERALEISERTLGAEHADTLGRLDGLGTLLHEQGDLAGARAHHERAMRVLVSAAGIDDPRTLAAINSVGQLLREEGDLAAARTYLEHALHTSEQVLGSDHPDTATALDNMGTLLQAEGDLAAAREHIERALAIREQALGSENPATGTSYNNLGMLLRAEGDLEGARPHLEQALIVSQRVLGPYDPQTADRYSNVGTLLLELNDLYGAQPHLERALTIREQGLGPEHPDTAVSLMNLARLHVAYGDVPGARRHLERALGIREQVVGPAHPLTAATAHELGKVLRELGETEAARERFQQAVSVREAELGPDDPETLASLTQLDDLERELSGGRRPAWPRQAPLEDTELFVADDE